VDDQNVLDIRILLLESTQGIHLVKNSSFKEFILIGKA